MPESFGEAEFAELLKTFKHSVWRLETLPVYCSQGELAAMDRFLSGDPNWAGEGLKNWAKRISEVTSGGKSWGRVHIVPKELTRYLQYEIFGSYPITAEGGARTGLIEGEAENLFADLDWPKQDFWIFDDETVVLMDYDGEGNLVGARKRTDAKTVRQCVAVKSRAEGRAIPLADYIATHKAQELA